MEHNDIRHRLSEYIDGSVTGEERAAIEAHLKTCMQCSSALKELRKAIEHIKAIEEIEPPAWMTQKIMAKVRAEAEKKGLFQRIFYPLTIKLPIQAVAVVFLAVTGFYIYQNIHPAQIPFEAPMQELANMKESPKNTLAKADDHALRAKQVPQALEYKALDMKQEYEKPTPPAPLDKEETPAPAALGKATERPEPANGNAASGKIVAAPQTGAPRIIKEEAGARLQSHAIRKSLVAPQNAQVTATEAMKNVDVHKYIGRFESELDSFEEISKIKSDKNTSRIGKDNVLLKRTIHGQIYILFAKVVADKDTSKTRDALITDAMEYPATGYNENLVEWWCSLNEQADEELMAVVDSSSNKKRLPAIRAWRMNRRSGKFEPISPAGISCINESHGN